MTVRRCGDLRGSADDDGVILSVPLTDVVDGFEDVPKLAGGARSLRNAGRSTAATVSLDECCSSTDVGIFNDDVRDAGGAA